jgi:cellobiose phosphorylase
MTSRFIKEKAEKNLEAIIKNMHPDNTDVLLMKEYHKLYKKNVSFFKRSWAAAWLFM